MGENTESLVSSGYLSASVNVGVAKLLAIAAEIGVEPSVYINGVPHFDQAGEDRIREHLSDAGPREARARARRPAAQ